MSIYDYQNQLPGGTPGDYMLEEPARYCDHTRNCDCRACERQRELDDFIDHEGTDPRGY